MSDFSRKLGLAILLAASCLVAQTAHAQVNPLTYWTPGWPIGFSGNTAAGLTSETYGNFPSFEGTDARGFTYSRYNFSDGWFVGTERGGLGLSNFSQYNAFGTSLYSEGVQFGYNLQKSIGLPLTVYGGFDTLKYNTGIGSAPFDSQTGTLPGYSAHAGVEFQASSNVSLSLGVGITQQSNRVDSDINSSLLPGASPFAFGGRR
jgi:opacity protein-like surface antigen